MIAALELYPHFAHAIGLMALTAWYLGVFPRTRWQPRYLPLALYSLLSLGVELARWGLPVLADVADPFSPAAGAGLSVAAIALLLWAVWCAESEGTTQRWPWPNRLPILLHGIVTFGLEPGYLGIAPFVLGGVCGSAVIASALLACHITANLAHVRRGGARVHWTMVIAVLVVVLLGYYALRSSIAGALVRSDGRLAERTLSIAATFDPVEVDAFANSGSSDLPSRLSEVITRIRSANRDALHVALVPLRPPPAVLNRYFEAVRIRIHALADGREAYSLVSDHRGTTTLALVKGIDRPGGILVLQVAGVSRSATLRAAILNTHLWIAFLSTFVLGCIAGYQRVVRYVDNRSALFDATALVSERLSNGEDPLATARWLVGYLHERLDVVRVDLWLVEPREDREGFVLSATAPSTRAEGEWVAFDQLPDGWGATLTAGDVVNAAVPRKGLAAMLESAGSARRVIAEPIMGPEHPWGAIALFHKAGHLLQGNELPAALRTIATTFATSLVRQERISLLRAAEERLRLIIGASVDGFWDVDFEHRFSHHAARWWNMLGIEAGEMPDTLDSVHELIHPDDLPHVVALCEEILPAGIRSVQMQYRARHSNGTWRWIDSSAVQLRTFHGPAQRMLGFDRDITDRREANERLHHALAAAEQANRIKSEFLASMSHELRTPLNSVIGFSSLLLRSPLSPRQREWVEASQSSAEHLLALINDLLDLSKIEAGRLELHPTVFELRALVEQVLGGFAKDAGDKGIALDYQLRGNGGPAWVLADELRFRQILTNLVGNAVKFTATGRVWVEIAAEGDEAWQFAVHDTGPGIPAEKLGRLFQRFSQLDPERTSRGGTGLGLAISRELAQQMGGDISAESELGQGSTFRFQVKLSPAHGPARRRSDTADLSRLSALLWNPHPIDAAVFDTLLQGTGLRLIPCAEEEEARRHLASDPSCVAVFFPRSFEPGQRATATHLRSARTIAKAGVQFVGFHAAPETAPSGTDYDILTPSPVRQRVVVDLMLGRTSSRPERAAALQQLDPGPILVAEDHPSNRLVMEAMLASLNCKADFVEDGAQAVEAMRARPYRIALLDVSMPVMDGVAVAKWARSEWQQAWPRPRLVAVTAFASRGDRERFLAEGMDDHLPKPISRETLHSVLSHGIRPSEPAEPAPDQLQNIEEVDWKRLEALLETVNARRNAASFRRIVENFTEQSTSSLEELAQIPDNDPVAAVRALHRFKGALSTLSFQAAAHTVSKAHDAGRLPPMGERTRWIEELRATIQRSLNSINSRYPWLTEHDA